MRHLYANRAAYTIAAVLILASVFFAWIRSQQIILVPEEDVVAAEFEGVTTLAEFDWQQLGADTYEADCASCHGDTGEGREEYPPLRIGVVNLFNVEGGRTFLIDVILYGLESDRHDAAHPPFYNLSDPQVAAVLNHVLTSWGNEDALPDDPDLYIPADVAEERDKDLSPSDVDEERSRLGPAEEAEAADELVASAGFDWQAQGEGLYEEHCSGCHLQVEEAPQLFMAEGGCDYLLALVLFGAENGLSHLGFAPDLGDEDVAAVLNQTLIASGQADALPEDAQLYRPEEVGAAREQDLAPEEVAELRPQP